MEADCDKCLHQNDPDTCEECSVNNDEGCTCAIGHAPCPYCEGFKFEEIET